VALAAPFLTDLDSRAAVKGSRDPLGVMAIWIRFGRHVIGNLTTVSSSLRDFTTLILGYYFAERVSNEEGNARDLETFLKWEQLGAYARAAVNEDFSFRGTERVQKNLNDGDRVPLSADANGQILSNQKIYGLWGLYSVATRSSGLLDGDPARLTPVGKALVEQHYLPVFTAAGLRNADAIVARLRERNSVLDVRGRDKRLIEAVAEVLKPKLRTAERQIYRDHLLLGGPSDRTEGRQKLLADLVKPTLDDPDWALSGSRIRRLAAAARPQAEAGASLADRLERIRTCELLLAPSTTLFSHLLGSENQTLKEVADAVRKQWGLSVPTIEIDSTTTLEGEFREATGDPDAARRWMQIARALAQGAYEDALKFLLEHNAAVMKARSAAAPWAVVRDGRIQVRFREDGIAPLPERKELPEYWQNPYFIDSLRQIARAVRV
jgi:hypothetical protein